MRAIPALGVAAALLLSVAAGPLARAEIVSRGAPPAGAVIAVKIGEEINFVDTEAWRLVDARQEVLAGDVLRTNALGQLAVLFADQTQIRLGRNTTLVVKDIGGDNARFGLTSGAIWARAARGGTGVTIDTPAAAAAVRGTDWSLTVAPDGRTSLIVLEGAVELANAQGSVLVREGEGASVGIGERPTKFVIVDVDDREQMLYYLTVRDAFTYMVASPLPSRAMIPEHARLAAIPPERRTPEERVAFAELAIAIDGIAATRDAIAAARAAPLTPALAARVTLVEAMVAGFDRDYPRAARLFEAAAPALPPGQRAIAAYGRYFARALADPSIDEPPPSSAAGGPYAVLAEAFAAGFLQTPAEAARVIAAAEARYPDEALLPAIRAQLAYLAGDVDQARAALTRAAALDPHNPVVLLARGLFRHGLESDLEGALEDLTAASLLQPGAEEIWNALGLVQSDRNALRESEAAFRRAIAENPHDPVPLVNLAVLYLENGQLARARELIDRAMALDPSLAALYVARGRYHLQSGEVDAAVEDLLKATTLDPALTDALALLAAAYFQRGDEEPGAQALENAGRLDPENPVVPQIASVVAIDRYDADTALRKARESLRRLRARGGSYTALTASREAGSTLNNAFRVLGLNAWGKAYADVADDPFDGGTYFDKFVSGAPDPFADTSEYTSVGPDPVPTDKAVSALFQGLLLYPYAASGGPSLHTSIYPTPFFETSAGAGWIAGDEDGPTASLGVNGHATSPFPVSLTAELSYAQGDPEASDVDRRVKNAFVMMGAQPTLQDRFALVGSFSDGQAPVPGTLAAPFLLDREDTMTGYGALGWSHTIGHRNVVNLGAVAGLVDGESLYDRRNDFGVGVTVGVEQPRRLAMVGGSHAIGSGPLTVRYGAEAGLVSGRDTLTVTPYIPFPLTPTVTETDLDGSVLRGWADVSLEATDRLMLQGSAFVTGLDGLGDDGVRFEPRVGAAWSVFDGHTVRLMASRESRVPGILTFAPTDVVGLSPLQTPVGATGRYDTLAARWDAEWTDRFFTALEVQHQEIDDLSLDVPDTPDTVAVPSASIDRVALTANAWLGHGVGAFGTVAWARSENDTAGPLEGDPLPFVPEWSARAGLTWVHPSRITASLFATWVGERSGGASGETLDPFTTLDAKLGWQSPDRHVSFDLAVYNILDDDFEIATDTPGWGRTFVGSLSVRF